MDLDVSQLPALLDLLREKGVGQFAGFGVSLTFSGPAPVMVEAPSNPEPKEQLTDPLLAVMQLRRGS